MEDQERMPTSKISDFFSSTYGEARTKFITACQARALDIESRLNPNAEGAFGEDLYTDVVCIGPADAANTLMLVSGTHGVEGYCGSGAQVGLLREGCFDDLSDDLNVILVHALNPYGFSHNRRVNEDNVDLNRNFLDFGDPARPAGDYSLVHDFVLPDDWDGPSRQHADQQLNQFAQTHGAAAFQAAVSSGQYDHPDGIFYGGNAPTWSNMTLRSVLNDRIVHTKTAAVIDFHTGLGPFGYGELIGFGNSQQMALAAQWYGDQVTDPDAGTSSSSSVNGMLAQAVIDAMEEREFSVITLEFGTYDVNTVLNALRGDNWLYQQTSSQIDLKAGIKDEIRKAFYPDTDDWKSSVWNRSREIVDLALKGLNSRCDLNE